LRVGYLSADFRRHPVSFFFEPLLRHHDPARVEVVCYSSNHRTDDLTAHLRGLAAQWRDVAALKDEQLAAAIRADGIDILVELGGHTAYSRLPVLARRPAPVQVTYLGYPFSTGLRAVDYLLADGVACPAEADDLYAEAVAVLPRPYLCFRPHPELAEVGPPPARVQGHVTFGSFNHVPKLTPATVALWSRVLHAVPRSRLVLMAGPFFDVEVCRSYQRQFAAHGIGPERLELNGPRPMAGYLAAYSRIDLALDPIPYNGGTTTCEALLTGVPVVTLAGQALFGRMGASILTGVGLPELVAATPDDYVARAAALASDLQRLTELRAELRPRFLASPLGDGPGLARHVEAMYRAMWRRACAGTAPGRLEIPEERR
jgi:predicted O-linked N-acetylglucosamine transferase (SPINDLY family)